MSTTRRHSIHALLLGLALLITGTALATSAICPISQHDAASLSGGTWGDWTCDSQCDRVDGRCASTNPTCANKPENPGGCTLDKKVVQKNGIKDNECPAPNEEDKGTKCALSTEPTDTVCAHEYECVKPLGADCRWEYEHDASEIKKYACTSPPM